ncbi:GNAT family N-acetyltransferase [Kushneria indalinina]|uniref:Ribosomal-protein-serine acetyltransferase n=1 Tax=Kushneria indalinina DSM 14324 TaxID=1122140 RepID=A0A3D9DZE4_9GAMM|nr:GNAT family protein [Kushneria indalinina]REC95614.1 ribosomal-protein-serine acetyltransferase [Kushneria indalinina DSM 14324]
MFHHSINETLSLSLLHPHMAPELYRLVADNRAHLSPWLGWVAHTVSPADSAGFIRQSLHDYADGKRLICGLHYHQTRPVLVGTISFNEILPATGRASLGYWLGERWQGQGLMTLACQAMTRLAFEHYGLEKVQISAATGNTRSRAVCERLGATLEGVITRAESVNGVVHDHAVYGLFRDSMALQVEAGE